MNTLVKKVLASRNVSFEDIVEKELEHISEYTGIQEACSILNNSPIDTTDILVVGDYDVDGTLGTYVLVKSLRHKGFQKVRYKIPNRETDGYGVSNNVLQYIKDTHPDIVITCDNGISALDKLTTLKELGIKVIVTDHHTIKENIDTSIVDVVINPHQDGDKGLFEDFCGTAVAYMLANELVDDEKFLQELLPFVAIATVCDTMPLVNENRYFVKEGLRVLPYVSNIALKELIYSLDITPRDVTTYTIGFGIGPRLNAPGRLKDATMVVDLLLETDIFEIQKGVARLNELNKIRQDWTQQGVERVLESLADKEIPEDRILGIIQYGIHPGIIGIVASRIQDVYPCPVVLITDKPKTKLLTGSARSVDGFNLYEKLAPISHVCEGFGGHAGAAGLTIAYENVFSYLKALGEIEFKTVETNKPIEQELISITIGDVEALKELEPFGQGNPKPRFTTSVDIDYVMIRERVVKFRSDGLDFVSFNDVMNTTIRLYDLGVKEGNTALRCTFEYYPSINEFNGKTTIQGVITKIINIRRRY